MSDRLSHACTQPSTHGADTSQEVHARLADVLWQAGDLDEAEAMALSLAAEMPPEAGGAGEVATAHG